MAEHKAGDTVILTATIVAFGVDVAVVRVDGAVGDSTVVVRLGNLAVEDTPSDEDRIRDAMAEAQDHPGRIITR